MNSNSRQALVVAAGLVGLLSSCLVAPKDTSRYVEEGIGAVDRASRTELAIAAADPSLDPDVLAAYQAEFEKDAKRSNGEIVAIRKRLEEQERMLQRSFETLANAFELVPGGEIAERLAGLIGNRVREDRAATSAAAQRAAQATTEAQAAAAKAGEAVASALEASRKDAERARQMDALVEHVKSMPEVDPRALRDEILAEARKAGSLETEEGRKALRAELLQAAQDLGFGPRKIAELEARSDEGLIEEFLGPAAGGSGLLVGLIALLRLSYGKSRSQKDIDDLWEKVAKVETRATVAEANALASNVVAAQMAKD